MIKKEHYKRSENEIIQWEQDIHRFYRILNITDPQEWITVHVKEIHSLFDVARHEGYMAGLESHEKK